MVRHARDDESGKMRLGCLFALLVLVAVLYYGIQFVEVQFRYYRMQDEVKTQASFAPILDDQTIRARLIAQADTLGLPLDSRAWTVRRTRDARGRLITIEAEYDDSVVIELPGIRKVWRFHFRPAASEPY
jgi:hypothetical protein